MVWPAREETFDLVRDLATGNYQALGALTVSGLATRLVIGATAFACVGLVGHYTFFWVVFHPVSAPTLDPSRKQWLCEPSSCQHLAMPTCLHRTHASLSHANNYLDVAIAMITCTCAHFTSK
jgi:hypothetical protein